MNPFSYQQVSGRDQTNFILTLDYYPPSDLDPYTYMLIGLEA